MTWVPFGVARGVDDGDATAGLPETLRWSSPHVAAATRTTTAATAMVIHREDLREDPEVTSESYFRQPSGGTTLLSVHFAWERLTDSVHRCRLPFCDVTIGLVQGSTGTLLVDTGTTLAEAAAIDRDVRQMAVCPITHVVLTHKHFDHVLGSSLFAEADIYCAPEVVEYLSSATDQIRDDALHYGADVAEIDRAIAALRSPHHGTYGAAHKAAYEAVVNLGNRTATITHPGRGHTTSDLIVVVPGADEDGPMVVFTGDLVEESADPAIDADSDVAAWPATLDRILAIGGRDALYVPGHGRVVDAEFVRRQRDWLKAREV
jgi:glyoxylase-like metal-dependent hydrolase (beta-lactamase superfamily II)